MRRRLVFNLLDCSLLFALAAMIVYFLYSGDVPGGSDWATHMSRIRFIEDNLPSFPRWCPESAFGTLFQWSYPSLSYYLVAFIAWISQLSIFESCKVYFTLILSTGAISTYALADELGMKRVGRLASGLLLLGAYNVYSWWWIGQLPNMTAVMFTPLALLGFLRAVRKQTLFSMMLAGLLYAAIVLTHLLNTLILGVILVCTGALMIFLRQELLLISRGPNLPPKYTLRLPKVLLLSIIEASALSSWWLLPYFAELDLPAFLSEMTGYGVIGAGESAWAIALKLEFLFEPSLYYMGIGHFALAVGCLIFIVRNREKVHDTEFLPVLWFFVSVFGGISPYLGIPMGLPFRFGPYMALAASLMGGIFMSVWERFFERLSRNKAAGLLLTGLLLACVLYQPILQAKNSFAMLEVNRPQAASLLSGVLRAGERLGSGSVNWINAFSDISQSYGAVPHVNEMWYAFWYHMFSNRTSARIPYFARNYNVRYFLTPHNDPYLTPIDANVHEVKGFNSSLVEPTTGKIMALFVGERVDYERIFISISSPDPSDVLLVYGGRLLEDATLNELKLFNLVYLSDLFYRSLDGFSSLLSQYLEEGGGLIIDTDARSYDLDEIPEVCPAKKTAVKESAFNLTAVTPSPITNGVDLNEFSKANYSVSYAEELGGNSYVLLADDEEPVMAYWEHGVGKVLWNGLRLPFHAMYYNNTEESKMLVNMIRYAATPPTETGASIDEFTLQLEKVTVKVHGASSETGVWVKISYHDGWRAYVEDSPLKIYLGGPHMMLVFPEINGSYTLDLRYEKNAAATIGELTTIAGFAVLLLAFIHGKWRIPRGWDKTVHKGSAIKKMKEKTR
ncbi:MAG: 6-pyruvoyl-tetrahydropterin synthase-related protein [Candidatus Bathyarchaeota archaeon]|nr:6-pyruvoyl-tetrahydropterin synthase-related protein [Candidatus Bathyarchaeota archaeon]